MFWQKPGENYVRIGELVPSEWTREVEGGRRVRDLKRHGRKETVSVWSLRDVVPRD